jgi:pyruvate dehydrogenase E2 component (dihydrolipoamide acetyltransferase)
VAQPAASVQAKPGHTYAPVAATEGERREPFSGMRRKIGEHLSLSKHTAPHFAYAEEIDMTELLATRQALKSAAEAQGVKLTFLPFIIKAAIAALKKYPSLNASLDETTQELVYKNVYNIGVATATDNGLVVPVIHNAHQKSILELAQAVASLSEKARTGKLSLDEMRGGTFTITSIGSVGGLFSVPIINYPEVAIIGINKITPRPVVRNGEIVIRDIMYLSISGDHRVVDGYETALFIKELQTTLEDPRLLLL